MLRSEDLDMLTRIFCKSKISTKKHQFGFGEFIFLITPSTVDLFSSFFMCSHLTWIIWDDHYFTPHSVHKYKATLFRLKSSYPHNRITFLVSIPQGMCLMCLIACYVFATSIRLETENVHKWMLASGI